MAWVIVFLLALCTFFLFDISMELSKIRELLRWRLDRDETRSYEEQH